MVNMNMTIWVDQKTARELIEKHSTPLFVYGKKQLTERAKQLLKLKLPFGHTTRYAVKANPHPGIIKLYDGLGLHFDASSAYEAKELIKLGVKPDKISLCSQSLAGPLQEVLKKGVLPVATSLQQMEILAEHKVRDLAIRVNPGFGSGHSNRVNVGGPASSFGIWHEYLDQAKLLAQKHNQAIVRLHTHIGSGADPKVWERVILMSLHIVSQLPEVTTLDIGGGYKIARIKDEKDTDMAGVARVFSREVQTFYERTGRKIHLEIEPGTYLVGNTGVLLSTVDDIVDTGAKGYRFIKLNTGMNDILRPSMYGAQHEIAVLNGKSVTAGYIVVGHNCESGDVLTPEPGDPEAILPRTLSVPKIGDIVAIGGTGAYCASMRASGYNAFPNAKEVLV